MAVNQTLKTASGSNAFANESDPDRNIRRPFTTGGTHICLSGRRVYDLQGIHYAFALEFNFMSATLYEALRKLYYSGELLFFDDGNVPPLVESGVILPTATYNYVGVTSPSGSHEAYISLSANIPSSAADFEDTEFTTAEYQEVDGDDSNAVETDDPNFSRYSYHKFIIKSAITQANTQRLEIKIASLSNTNPNTGNKGAVVSGWNGVIWDEIARSDTATKTDIEYTTTKTELAQRLVDSSSAEIKLLHRSKDFHIAPRFGNINTESGVSQSVEVLLVYQDELYAATYGNPDGGTMKKWDGEDVWTEVAPKLGGEYNIFCGVVYNGKIYVGTGPNGKLYEWNGSNQWVEKADTLAGGNTLMGMVVYNGLLYAVSANGYLQEWNGTNAWVQKAGPGLAPSDMVVYDDDIYVCASDRYLLRWDDVSAFDNLNDNFGSGNVTTLAVHRGRLYTSGFLSELLRWDDVNDWDSVAASPPDPAGAWNTRKLLSSEGNLYSIGAGVGDDSHVIRWNEVDAWVVALTPNVESSVNAVGLVAYKGLLYVGGVGAVKIWQYSEQGWNMTFSSYYVEVVVNPNGTIIALTHTPILSSGDVISVKNLTQETTLILTTHYTISGKEITVTGQANDDVIEVTYNRYFEVKFDNIPEEWLSGDPASDRERAAIVNLSTLTGGAVDS